MTRATVPAKEVKLPAMKRSILAIQASRVEHVLCTTEDPSKHQHRLFFLWQFGENKEVRLLVQPPKKLVLLVYPFQGILPSHEGLVARCIPFQHRCFSSYLPHG